MHICLISGSTLGSAEYVAEHLEDVLKTQDFSTALFHGPELDDVIDENIWFDIVVAIMRTKPANNRRG